MEGLEKKVDVFVYREIVGWNGGWGAGLLDAERRSRVPEMGCWMMRDGDRSGDLCFFDLSVVDDVLEGGGYQSVRKGRCLGSCLDVTDAYS